MNSKVSISEDRKPRSRYCGSERCGAPLASTVTRERQSVLSRDVHSHAPITSPFYSGRCLLLPHRAACVSQLSLTTKEIGGSSRLRGWRSLFQAVCPSIADGSSKPRIPDAVFISTSVYGLDRSALHLAARPGASVVAPAKLRAQHAAAFSLRLALNAGRRALRIHPKSKGESTWFPRSFALFS